MAGVLQVTKIDMKTMTAEETVLIPISRIDSMKQVKLRLPPYDRVQEGTEIAKVNGDLVYVLEDILTVKWQFEQA